ncbi:hypothetical membrane protein [Thermococcus kodakarensis KOD1]|uniref:Hypothetical membrane protein n=1 Tax=Thermococcus kodakarensis (strain ATCC BAA-918 / JCM 12380 / KOD1) TaxID=69014 RepID=Q5JEQ7_THEKO|nr:hypothetical protein [Thermococcus kodakarensis]WCN27792.1 hypothetical protein POG15_09645 [Thermococcus kodakarensis]WCN30088.1 hypothetical protein POG21_09630 [Thermococcus kodakarensis]BAD86083.1 hypothetical membrane protein [Thermococcus kodakarensis KOD1]
MATRTGSRTLRYIFFFLINLPWAFALAYYQTLGWLAIVLAALFASIATEVERVFILKQREIKIRDFVLDFIAFVGALYMVSLLLKVG